MSSNGSSRSAKSPWRNVPPAAGAKPATAYTRFIPREELGEVESWRPGSFGSVGHAARAGVEPAHNGTGHAPQAAQGTPPEPGADEWRARVQAARQAGYQDGYRDGMAALENFKQQFAAQATAQVGTLLDAFDRQLAAMDEQIARTLARTAVQLAREVVRGELVAQPALVARVATEALNAVMLSARHITVLAHPQDLPLVAAGAEEALAARGARLVADAAVARGGVAIESDVGRVDAGIARRWQQAAEALAPEVAWAAAGESTADAAGETIHAGDAEAPR